MANRCRQQNDQAWPGATFVKRKALRLRIVYGSFSRISRLFGAAAGERRTASELVVEGFRSGAADMVAGYATQASGLRG